MSLVKSVAKELQVKPQKLSVNNLQTGSGDVLIRSSKGYYRIIFNNDNSEYALEKIRLKAGDINVKGD